MLEIALACIPLLLLLGFLLFGRYPGCDAIVALSDRIAGRSSGRATAPLRTRLPLPPRSFAASGGLLIASGHAQRPPPVAP
jgi:hypothetical protein